MARGFRIGYPRAVRVSGDFGTYTNTGTAASLLKGYRSTADQGTYSVSGQDSTLTFTGGGSAGPLSSDFTVTSSVGGTNVPFSLGYAFRQGDVPSGQIATTADASSWQCTVKNSWPDGSAKFAILAGRKTLTAGVAATVTLTAAAPGGGTALTTTDLKTAMSGQTCSIGCGAFGTVSWATTDFDSPFQTWVSGPVMSSWVYRKPVGSDAHLVGWIEVRLFAGGAVEVLPWVENGYFNVAGPTNKSATYTFTLGSTQRESLAIDLPNHCRTPLLSSTRLSHWLSTDPGCSVKHNAAYLMATELVPTYWGSVSSGSGVITGLPSTYTPLQQGNYPTAMGSAGYDLSIGLLPQWDVAYLTSTATTVWAALQRNAYSAGRYGVHHRDETTNRPPRFSSYPTTVLGEGNGIESIGSTSGSFTPDATGTTPATTSFSHHPSMGFMAYLVTGRWYHMETMQFVATANHFRSSAAPRQNALGILQTWSATSTRGAAWGLRTLAQAACITPDSDTTMRAEFVDAYKNNINEHHATYVAGSNSPLGFMQPFTNYTASVSQNAGAASTSTQIVLPGGVDSTDDYYNVVFANGGRWTITIGGQTRNVVDWVGATTTATVSPAFTVTTANQPSVLRSNHWYEAAWQQDFYTGALGYSLCLGLISDTPTRTKESEFFHWKAKSIVGRFGGTGATEYLYREAATYTLSVAESDSWASWQSDWGKIWTNARLYNAYGNSAKSLGDGSLNGTTTDLGSFWGNLQPALAYAVRHGAEGAAAARALMMSAPNWAVLSATASSYPEWSVMPPSVSWMSGSLNAWSEFASTPLSSVPGFNGAATSGKQDAWAGWHIDQRTGTVYSVGQGGHDDYWGNEVDKLALHTNTPAWAEVLAGTATGNVTFDADYYSDGKPASHHGYYGAVYIERLNKALRMFGGSRSKSGNPTQRISAFNTLTGAYDIESTWSSPSPPTLVGANSATFAKHPYTEKVYCWFYNAAICVWDPASPTSLTTLISNPSNPAAADTAAAVDPMFNQVFFLGGGAGGTMCRAYDIATNAVRTITLTGTDISGGVGTGMFWCDALRKFVVALRTSGGPSIYTITPDASSSWACAALSTTGGGSLPATNDAGGAQGPRTKWLYSPRHGHAIFGPRWGSNVWRLKLHEV